VREHRSVLAAAEKRVLVWMAGRLPAAIHSDHLSALGLASMAAASLALVALRVTPWAAVAFVVCLAANWFGDSLDGTVARVRGHQRPRYGYYVDHVIDVLGTTFLFVGLAASGIMHPLVSSILLAAYLLVAAESYLATHTVGVFRISFLGFGPTELRILLAVGVVNVMKTPWIDMAGLGSVRLFDVGGIIAAIALGLVFIASAVRNTLALYRAEPLPQRSVSASRAA
jgi:phosphatidylglycerophosphate synthase